MRGSKCFVRCGKSLVSTCNIEALPRLGEETATSGKKTVENFEFVVGKERVSRFTLSCCRSSSPAGVSVETFAAMHLPRAAARDDVGIERHGVGRVLVSQQRLTGTLSWRTDVVLGPYAYFQMNGALIEEHGGIDSDRLHLVFLLFVALR